MPVVSVTEDENINAAGELAYVYVITFTIPDRSGSFTVTVPKSGDAVAEADKEISAVVNDVTGIYKLA